MQRIPEQLEWHPVRIKNIQNTFKCQKCAREVLLHPNYINRNLTACVSPGGCDDLEEVCKKMLILRTYTLEKIERTDGRAYIYFVCGKGHSEKVSYQSLRKGSGCKICQKNPKEKKTTREKLIRPNCSCESSRSAKPKVCQHYNHAILYPESAKDWDYKLNDDTPYNIGPRSALMRWWKCPNEWCQMSYEQRIFTRITENTRCPYCAGQKVCHWNSFQTQHPELMGEWHIDNTILPSQITSGSEKIVLWICQLHEIPHEWNAVVNDRSRGSGCPKCVKGYNQKTGGHEYFVQEANRIHKNKYQYPEKYSETHVKISIYCPIVDKNGKSHGIFRQTPQNHKNGNGCPKCAQDKHESIYVRRFQSILDELGFPIDQGSIAEHSFPGLICNKQLRVDRWIPKENIVFEIDGEYHFRICDDRGGIKRFIKDQRRDIIKDKYCLENGYSMIRIPFTINPTKEFIEEILKSCRINQTYITYKEYFDEVKCLIDLSKITVIIVDSP